MPNTCLEVVAKKARGKESLRAPGTSAEAHHVYLVKLYRLSNRIRREFIAELLSLAEQRLYLALGSPSIVEYAERHLLSASQTYDYLRVGKALRELSHGLFSLEGCQCHFGFECR